MSKSPLILCYMLSYLLCEGCHFLSAFFSSRITTSPRFVTVSSSPLGCLHTLPSESERRVQMLCRPCRPWTMPPTVCPMNDRSADNRPDGGPPSRPCRGRSSTLSLSSAPLGLLRGSPVLCGARAGYLPFFFGWPGRDLYPH